MLKRLGLVARRQPDWSEWQRLVEEVRRPKPIVKIALVGKYVELHDAYMSVREVSTPRGPVEWRGSGYQLGALLRVRKGAWLGSCSKCRWHSCTGRFPAAAAQREKFKPPATPVSIKSLTWACAWECNLMVVEFSRNVLEHEDANSTEFDPSTSYPVIDLMPDQRSVSDMGGTMRLGLYPCELQPGTHAAEAYPQSLVQERHRHRFELNNTYREALQSNGMCFSGISPDGRLVEIAELTDHPFMLGTQFHPEFLSRPNRPHPLFVAFLKAVKKQKYPDNL